MNMATHGDGDMAMGTAAAPTVAVDSHKTSAVVDGMGGGFNQDAGFANGYRDGTWGINNQMGGSAFYSEFQGREAAAGGGMFDGMALPDHFLKQYYAQVSHNDSY